MNKKRLVSKTEYVEHLAKKTGLSGFSTFLYIVGFVGLVFSVIWAAFLLYSLLSGTAGPDRKLYLQLLLACGLIGAGMGAVIKASLALSRRAETMPEVVPLTQHTADQLPAEESLVRASSEPTEQLGTVLLRAAQSSGETPADELLRSSTPSQPPDQTIS